MRYRIRPRIYACFTHSDRLPVVQSSITTYVVQVRKWYGWVTVKEYDEGFDSDFALSQAEDTSRGHAQMTSGGLDVSTARAKNSSRRLITTARRKVVNMKESSNMLNQ